MDYASLQDAFPTLGGKPSTKKKKSYREPYTDLELPPTDPDRPAYKRLFDVPPMKQPSTDGIPDTYLDESTKFQGKSTVMNSLPNVRDSGSAATAAIPSYFGAEGFENPNEDTKALFTTITRPNTYMLDSDFTQAFDSKAGFGKASGGTLPVPELRQRWKALSTGGIDSAFYETPKSGQFTGLDTSDMASMKMKLDALIARLDDMDNRSLSSNPQMEMLSFIMVGLFLMFGLDVAVRKSSGMRLLNVR